MTETLPLLKQRESTAARMCYPPAPQNENWASLKSLEKVLATVIGEKRARAELGPVHGIYNLRLADAHVASKDLDEAFALAHVSRTLPFVMQGRDLLITCVTSLHRIAEALEMIEE